MRDYQYYKPLPLHNGETFGCGMPLKLDPAQLQKIEELEGCSNASLPENSIFYGRDFDDDGGASQLMSAGLSAKEA